MPQRDSLLNLYLELWNRLNDKEERKLGQTRTQDENLSTEGGVVMREPRN